MRRASRPIASLFSHRHEGLTLDDLDALEPHDPARDAISKRLTPAEQIALMARYGYAWTPRA